MNMVASKINLVKMKNNFVFVNGVLTTMDSIVNPNG